MQLDFKSEVPIYIQIADGIEDAILSGGFPEEKQVPSTTELSAAYQINPATVLKGMSLLTEEGILYKKRGVGMFVAAGAAEKILNKRRQSFYDHYIVSLLEEAEKLRIGKEELIHMIEGGGNHEQQH